MYRLLFANDFWHVLGSRSYVFGLLIDTRVVALLGLRTPVISLADRSIMTIWAVRLWGRNFSVPCFAIYRELLWIAEGRSDTDSNLISWHVKRRLMSQNAPGHARQFICKGDGSLVSIHAF